MPAGVKLAAVQELVRANGYEPATLDPNLAESNVEFYIFNDLFEGLLRVGKDGEVIPALAQTWEHQATSGLSICGRRPNGRTAIR
ncbi:hypothetical protein AK51_22390 [Serratia nematodiphila DZ0503SBS1]|nr:hypothetical protein AK51_22390 [Serratia nematodiphila DZ0503SBS1]